MHLYHKGARQQCLSHLLPVRSNRTEFPEAPLAFCWSFCIQHKKSLIKYQRDPTMGLLHAKPAGILFCGWLWEAVLSFWSAVDSTASSATAGLQQTWGLLMADYMFIRPQVFIKGGVVRLFLCFVPGGFSVHARIILKYYCIL